MRTSNLRRGDLLIIRVDDSTTLASVEYFNDDCSVMVCIKKGFRRGEKIRVSEDNIISFA